MSFSFVHAADLHLDSPFTCLTQQAREVAAVLQAATFAAYEALIQLCIDREVQFLLVAGDVYDGADRSLRAQLRFLDGLERLAAHGIQAFVVHGNHDPLDGWSASVQWPDGVHVFGGQDVETIEAAMAGRPVAAVSGISYPEKKETRRLAEAFRADNPDLFQIALLHCNCGASAEHEPYAPCQPGDLTSAGFDYWALGHVHTRNVVATNPHVVYPGNPQGRNIRETGARGCYHVTVTDDRAVDLTFFPLDTVRWATAEVRIDAIETVDELDRALAAAVADVRTGAEGRPAVCRIALAGRGALYGALNRDDAMADLLARTREEGSAEDPFVWVEKLDGQCGPAIDLERLRTRNDLLGQLLRIAQDLRDSETLAEALAPALGELDGHRRAGKALEHLTRDDLEALLRDAEYLCATLLEAAP